MSDIESKSKIVLTEEQKAEKKALLAARLKAGRDAAKAKRDADKAAGIEPPPKVKKTASKSATIEDAPSKPKKSPLTKKIWENVLNEVRKDLKPEFEAYVKSKME
jgi:hypothetical protein